jgi:hypothetical protein
MTLIIDLRQSFQMRSGPPPKSYSLRKVNASSVEGIGKSMQLKEKDIEFEFHCAFLLSNKFSR